jgi:hypothetical protein
MPDGSCQRGRDEAGALKERPRALKAWLIPSA